MVSDSGRMSRLGFPLIADNEVFEMLQNAKRGCGNFTPLGSYVTVAFAASMAILWVIVVLHEVWCNLQPLLWHLYFVVYWHVVLGILAGFLRILPMVVLHCGENLFWVIFAKIHQL